MVKKIMWDPGHGGSDPGAGANGIQEKHLTFKIVEYAMAYINLNYTGFEQRATRGNDQTLELSKRDDEADSWGSNVFISVHINAGGGTGFESYIHDSAGATTIALQNMIHNEVLAAMRQFGSITDRGKKRANFSVLRETNMDAVLTENLFIDSVSDSNKLKDEAFLKAVGEAHARGVAAFLGLQKKVLTSRIISIYTGGFGGEDLATIQTFLAANNWWYQPSRNEDGTISFLVGGFGEGSEAAKKLETFLNENNWWYEIR